MTGDNEVREKHDYDRPTGFCRRCGLHREMVDADDLLCVGAENVVAISHLRAQQIREVEIARVTKSLK